MSHKSKTIFINSLIVVILGYLTFFINKEHGNYRIQPYLISFVITLLLFLSIRRIEIKKMDFRHGAEKDFISRYIIYRKKDIVYVVNYDFPDTEKKPKLNILRIHTANIPAMLQAIAFVFEALPERGEPKSITGNGEKVLVYMEKERMITEVSLQTERKNEIPFFLKFHFDRGDIPVEPGKRVLTPAMVWVMTAMKEKYDAWLEEEEYGRQTISERVKKDFGIILWKLRGYKREKFNEI